MIDPILCNSFAGPAPPVGISNRYLKEVAFPDTFFESELQILLKISIKNKIVNC